MTHTGARAVPLAKLPGEAAAATLSEAEGERGVGSSEKPALSLRATFARQVDTLVR